MLGQFLSQAFPAHRQGLSVAHDFLKRQQLCSFPAHEGVRVILHQDCEFSRAIVVYQLYWRRKIAQ
jgi:hypothetical protein